MERTNEEVEADLLKFKWLIKSLITFKNELSAMSLDVLLYYIVRFDFVIALPGVW